MAFDCDNSLLCSLYDFYGTVTGIYYEITELKLKNKKVLCRTGEKNKKTCAA